ncbi:hypothetical protein Sjap_020284 [Stephania japonica]|uniref:GHMP kinase N-terminal domain-containing protein n=1 Tax=Stephania japonica TaxID=461633 RepID=A0AAP0F0D1_9MAGN
MRGRTRVIILGSFIAVAVDLRFDDDALSADLLGVWESLPTDALVPDGAAGPPIGRNQGRKVYFPFNPFSSSPFSLELQPNPKHFLSVLLHRRLCSSLASPSSSALLSLAGPSSSAFFIGSALSRGSFFIGFALAGPSSSAFAEFPASVSASHFHLLREVETQCGSIQCFAIVSTAPPSPISPPSISAKPSPLSPPSFSAPSSHLLCSGNIVSASAIPPSQNLTMPLHSSDIVRLLKLLAYCPSGWRRISTLMSGCIEVLCFDQDNLREKIDEVQNTVVDSKENERAPSPILEKNDWGTYAKGALYALQQEGMNLTQGIKGMISGSECLDSSGLSSSAAVGVAYLLALESANGLTVLPDVNIELDRLIENEYLGLKNGILDQSAILLSSYGCLT